MSLRIFTCSGCGHRMRLRGTRCGRCYHTKEVYKNRLFYIGTGASILAGAAVWATVA